MATPLDEPRVRFAFLGKAGMVPVAFLVGSVGLTSCTAIDRVKSAVDDIRGNQATIDAFSSKLQSGAATPFEATYVTTGSAPATIVYAVRASHGSGLQRDSVGRKRDDTGAPRGRLLRRVRLHATIRPRAHNGRARNSEPPVRPRRTRSSTSTRRRTGSAFSKASPWWPASRATRSPPRR